MILILKSNATDDQIDHVLERVEAMGLQHHLSRGTFRTIVGIIGDEEKLRQEPMRAIPGVAQVIPVLPAYKLASRDAHPEASVIDVSGVKIGGGHLGMIAGPCSVEEPERMFRIAESVCKSGANLFRGGAFKPRTSPYAFQGMGEEGLAFASARSVTNFKIPIVTEVTDPRLVDLVSEYADMLQVGARNMQNFALLTEVGKSKRPVLLKRGMSATINDLLMCAEYILSQGNSNVVLCERGIKSFDPATRNLFGCGRRACQSNHCHTFRSLSIHHMRQDVPTSSHRVLLQDWQLVRTVFTSKSMTVLRLRKVMDRKRFFPNNTMNWQVR